MATFANISDAVTAAITSRTGALADNVTQNTPLLKKMRERGNVKTFSGGTQIYQEIMYNDTSTINANSFSGYDAIDITPNSPISSAVFDIKQYAAAVSISGLEMLQNAGKERIIDLLEGRVTVAEAQLINKINADLYGDGTSNGGKALVGTASAISTTPTSGTYGGINRATWSFWRNVAFDATTDGGAAATASNIQSYMNSVAIQLVRNSDHPDLIVADNNYYKLFLESLQSIQRLASADSGKAGFTSISYMGAGMSSEVYLAGGVGGTIPSNRMYFINTKYLHFRPHVNQNFGPLGGDRTSVNQDALVKMMGWAGALTCSGAQFNGVLGD
jgi:hypothetical protein